MTAGLITVRLPIPAHLPEQVQRDCVNLVDYGLRTTYKMQVVPFQLATPNGTHWVRISAQVYLEHQDFEYLASATLKLISQCVKRVSSEVEG
uniref:Uncharacterized protein n=1 Tax=Pyrodinium bahamense TaxID=73915 RepID=A0A7S0AHL5_9DINO